jgi:hypothetical protein
MGSSSMGKCGDLVPWGKWIQVPRGKLVPYIKTCFLKANVLKGIVMFGEYGPKTWFLEANGIEFPGKLGSLGQMGPSSPRHFTLGKNVKFFRKTCFLGSLGKMGTSFPRNSGC